MTNISKWYTYLDTNYTKGSSYIIICLFYVFINRYTHQTFGMRFGLVMLIVIVVLQVPANGHGESQKTGCTNYVSDNRGSQNYEPAVEHPHLTRLVRHIYPDLCEGLVGQGRLLVVSILHPNLVKGCFRAAQPRFVFICFS